MLKWFPSIVLLFLSITVNFFVNLYEICVAAQQNPSDLAVTKVWKFSQNEHLDSLCSDDQDSIKLYKEKSTHMTNLFHFVFTFQLLTFRQCNAPALSHHY